MTHSLFKKQNLIELITFCVIFLFFYAGLSKLMDYKGFETQIGQSPMLVDIKNIVAIVVPIFEILLAILLMLPRCRLLSLYISYALMIAFSAYIIIVMNFSEHIPCSCGGILEEMSWTQHLIFNIFFSTICLVAILLYPLQSVVKNRGSRKSVTE